MPSRMVLIWLAMRRILLLLTEAFVSPMSANQAAIFALCPSQSAKSWLGLFTEVAQPLCQPPTA
eukprot:1033241-Amphidinium_carterae.1